MTIEQQVLEKLCELAPEKQKAVLNLVDSLKRPDAPKAPRRSLLRAMGGPELSPVARATICGLCPTATGRNAMVLDPANLKRELTNYKDLVFVATSPLASTT
jgi:hypothetical protein